MPTYSPRDNQSSTMRWIAFFIVSVLFVATAVKAILTGRSVDTIIAGIFVIVIGGAWGANLFDNVLKK